jgi:anti-anti-sigma factor
MTDVVPNARILVVDDEAVIRTVLVAALKRGGYSDVVAANGGLPAQRQLLAGTFDLVITDISMPDMDGLALMRWALETLPGPPAWIILSGDATFQNAVKAVKLGAFDFISKPLTEFDSFLVAVRNALRQRQLLADQARLTAELARHVMRLEQALHLLSTQAEIIHLDLQRAELIQRTLLPARPPRDGRFAFNALYRASHKVGGDLYDVLPIDDRTCVFYVADAAGHGISAAMVSVLFKLSLAVREPGTGALIPPAKALAAVNARVFRECAAPGLFITAALCALDTETGELSVASGGHTPLLLQRGGHELEYIPRTGPALGLAGEQTYGTFVTRLGPGDRLLLYTDGLTDPRTNARGLSLIELGAMLAAPADSPQARLEHLAAEVFRRTGAPLLEDDLTLLLVSEGAAGSAWDNGESLSAMGGEEAPPDDDDTPGAYVARHSDATFFHLAGRGVWTEATAFHEACSAELANGRTVVLDLEGCDYLDSTFLGTLHELTAAGGGRSGALVLQRMSPEVRRLCEELGLERVLSLVAAQARPLPADFASLRPQPAVIRRGRERILAAHEQLATISPDNQARFSGVLEELRHPGPAAPKP